jgi:hypothetical protein
MIRTLRLPNMSIALAYPQNFSSEQPFPNDVSPDRFLVPMTRLMRLAVAFSKNEKLPHITRCNQQPMPVRYGGGAFV